MTKKYRIQWENNFECFDSLESALARYKELKEMTLAGLIWEVSLHEVKGKVLILRACAFNKRG